MNFKFTRVSPHFSNCSNNKKIRVFIEKSEKSKCLIDHSLSFLLTTMASLIGQVMRG